MKTINTLWITPGISSGLPVDYFYCFLAKIEKEKNMISGENTGNISKPNQKLEEFKRKHSDMEAELKRRLMMLKMKNLRLFLKQID